MTKVTFETATLADAVKKADRVAPSRGQAFDKAAGMVLEVSPSPLPAVIRATDLEIFSMEWVETVDVEGDAVSWRLPSKLFAQVVSSLPIGSGKTVTLEEKVAGHSSQLHLVSGRTKARFNILDISYYPEWAAFDPDDLYPASDLGGRISMVSWAAAKSEVPLAGVYLDGEKAVATDRYRMASSELKIPDLERPVVVPGGIIGQVLKQTGEVSIGVTNNQLLIMPDEYTQIRTVIYDLAYPKVDAAMKRNQPEHMSVRKEPLLEVMNRASNFAGGERIPTLKCFFGKEEIAVMMTNEEVGLLGDVVEVPGFATHNRVEFKFTPKNIIDAISNSPNDTLDMYYDPENTSQIIYVHGGSGYEAWIVPRREIADTEG